MILRMRKGGPGCWPGFKRKDRLRTKPQSCCIAGPPLLLRADGKFGKDPPDLEGGDSSLGLCWWMNSNSFVLPRVNLTESKQ